MKRRRTVPRHHAAHALASGRCLLAHRGDCTPTVASVGLRDPHDIDAVLICYHHLADLRQLRPREAEALARYFHVVFRSRIGVAA